MSHKNQCSLWKIFSLPDWTMDWEQGGLRENRQAKETGLWEHCSKAACNYYREINRKSYNLSIHSLILRSIVTRIKTLRYSQSEFAHGLGSSLFISCSKVHNEPKLEKELSSHSATTLLENSGYQQNWDPEEQSSYSSCNSLKSRKNTATFPLTKVFYLLPEQATQKMRRKMGNKFQQINFLCFCSKVLYHIINIFLQLLLLLFFSLTIK